MRHVVGKKAFMARELEQIQHSITEILRDAEGLVEKELTAPHDFVTLKESALQMDLREAIEQLEKLLDSDNVDKIREVFKELCKKRSEANAASAFSMFTAPNNTVNELFWNIGNCLFDLKTQNEALELFAPNVRHIVTLDFEVIDASKKQTDPKNIRFNPNVAPIASVLKGSASLDRFGNFVVVDDTVFDLTTIAEMPLGYLQAFISELEANKKFRSLVPAIYQHNDAFRQLSDDILTINNQGRTPRQVIEDFARKLELGGSKVHGGDVASNTAVVAHTDFIGYLESLPDEFKAQLKQMSGGDITLDEIMKRLASENCVEIAARTLKQVLSNPSNKALLDAPVKLDIYAVRAIKGRYGTKDGMPMQPSGTEKQLPEHLVEQSLSKLEIDDEEQMINLLTSFSHNHYRYLLKYANINPGIFDVQRAFFNHIKNGILGEDGTHAFLEAIVFNNQKTPNYKSLIVACGAQYVKKYLENAHQDERYDAVTEKDNHGYTLLHYAATYPESIRVILGFLPKSDLMKALKDKNCHNETVLHIASENYESLLAILEILPKNMRMEALDAVKFQAFLHNQAGNPEHLKRILQLLPENELFKVINFPDHNRKDKTVLHLAMLHPESMQVILDFFPEDKLLESLKVLDRDGQPVIWSATNNLSTLLVILEHLPENQRFEAVQIKNSAGMPLIYFVAGCYPATIQRMLELIPRGERLAALQTSMNSWNVLSLIEDKPETLKSTISLVLSPEQFNEFESEHPDMMCDNIAGLEEYLKQRVPDNSNQLASSSGYTPHATSVSKAPATGLDAQERRNRN